MNAETLLRSPAWIQPRIPKSMEILFDKEGQIYKLKKNSVLAHEGEPLTMVYYLIKGMCRYTFAQLNEQAITLSLILPGRAMGDIFSVIGTGLFMRFETLQDCTFKCIPKTLFMRKLQENNNFAMDVMAYFTNKQHSHVEGMICNMVLSPVQRIHKLLLTIADDRPEQDEDGFIKLPYKLTQELLAEVTGSSRVTVNRILKEWFNQDYLRKKDGFLYLNKKIINS